MEIACVEAGSARLRPVPGGGTARLRPRLAVLPAAAGEWSSFFKMSDMWGMTRIAAAPSRGKKHRQHKHCRRAGHRTLWGYTPCSPASLIGGRIAVSIEGLIVVRIWGGGVGLDLRCATVPLVVDAFTREQCGVPGQMLINASTLHIRNAHLSAKTA